MKGIIFTVLNDLVEEKFGLATWDRLLDRVGVEGIYTAADTYPDEEMVTMVKELSSQTGLPVPDLLRAYGEYAFEKFVGLYPVFLKPDMTAKDFLSSVNDIIHVEVKKLYFDAKPPAFHYENPAPDQLVMKYRSPRKLCPLVEGLIDGTARHFGETITHTHTQCMHDGHDHCRFELQFAHLAGHIQDADELTTTIETK